MGWKKNTGAVAGCGVGLALAWSLAGQPSSNDLMNWNEFRDNRAQIDAVINIVHATSAIDLALPSAFQAAYKDKKVDPADCKILDAAYSIIEKNAAVVKATTDRRVERGTITSKTAAQAYRISESYDRSSFPVSLVFENCP